MFPSVAAVALPLITGYIRTMSHSKLHQSSFAHAVLDALKHTHSNRMSLSKSSTAKHELQRQSPFFLSCAATPPRQISVDEFTGVHVKNFFIGRHA